MNLCRWTVLTVLAALLPAAVAQSTAGNRIFRLGHFDRSSEEFKDGVPSRLVHIDASQPNAAYGWFALHPAATPASPPSAATAPRTIDFRLSAPIATAYKLHLALLIENTGVPALRVTINGHSGTFYLHPQLDFDAGDDNDLPDFSHADIVVAVPASYLHTGSNTLALQAIEPSETRGATLAYDAIELDCSDTAGEPQATSAAIAPTIYYRKVDGHLEELVDIFLRRDPFGARTTGDTFFDLELAGHHYHQPLRADDRFGEEKIELSLPEFPAETVTTLTWQIDGHTRTVRQSITPAKKWTVYLVPHIHLDVGYSDYQAKVAAIQSRAIDEALDLAASHPGFSYSLDGEWPLDEFFRTHSSADQQRALDAIHNGTLFVPAQYANLLTGFPSAETLIRSLYPSAKFSREHHTPFNYANITDVPSYSWSYPSILAAAGIRQLIAGCNSRNVRSPQLMQGHLNEASPMWWAGPDGARVLFWYSRGYQQMRGLFGLPPSIESGRETLPLFLQQYDHPSYRASAVIMYGTQHENTDLFPQQATLAADWNSLFAYPHLEYSGMHDALEAIAAQFNNNLPTIRGDGGPYWEDGIAADALYGAAERSNEARAPSAEQLQTLASLLNPHLAADKSRLDRLWNDLVLMDEHTFASSDSVSTPSSNEATAQIAQKDAFATDAHDTAAWLIRSATEFIAGSISTGQGSLVVFNTLNWQRSAFVEADIRMNQQIIDASTKLSVPFEELHRDHDLLHVRFLATDVPSIGYKVFLLRPTAVAQAPSSAANSSPRTTTLESPFYRVELDPLTGSIRSIIDKQLHRELVDLHSPYRFGQYLYVTGGDREPNRILDYRVVSPLPHLQIHPARSGRILSIANTPTGWMARLQSSATNTPAIITEIRLSATTKQIEITEDVDKVQVFTKEAAYIAFPLAMSHPQFQYEIQTGVVDPSSDMYAGAGHEWFSMQHWVSAQQDGLSATIFPLDAALVTLGDINRGAWPAQFRDRRGAIFSYIMNNYWNTNYRAGQGGHFSFRYVVTSAPTTDPVSLSRQGWQHATPLEVDEIKSEDSAIDVPRALSGTRSSFLHTSDTALLLSAWKPAEDGNGTILRFLDLGGDGRSATVTLPAFTLTHAWLTDAVERDQRPLAVTNPNTLQLPIAPHGIVTVRITTAPELQPQP